MKESSGKLQEILWKTEQLENELDQEQLTLVSFQRYESQQLSALKLYEHNTPSLISQELQSLLKHCQRYGHTQLFILFISVNVYFSIKHHSQMND